MLSGASPPLAIMLALSLTDARVYACTSVTATVAPAVPAEPSALLTTSRVVFAVKATSPDIDSKLVPLTFIAESLTNTTMVTAASEAVSVSEPSASSSNTAVTLTLATAVRLVADSVVLSKITLAIGRIVNRLASTVLAIVDGVAEMLAVAVAESITSPDTVIDAPVRSIIASGVAIYRPWKSPSRYSPSASTAPSSSSNAVSIREFTFTVDEILIFSALITNWSAVTLPVTFTSSLPLPPLMIRSTPVRSTASMVRMSRERKGIGLSGSAMKLSSLAPRLIVRLAEGFANVGLSKVIESNGAVSDTVSIPPDSDRVAVSEKADRSITRFTVSELSVIGSSPS